MKLPTSISISSLSGVGKSRTGKLLLAKLQEPTVTDGEEPWQLLDLGLLPRQWAKEQGKTIEQEAAGRPAELDLKIDNAARDAFRRGHSIVLGRLSWWTAAEPEFGGKIFRVWLDRPSRVCAERRWLDGGGDKEAIHQKMVTRDIDDAHRYKECYKINLPPFSDRVDLVVSTLIHNADSVTKRIFECARCWANGWSYAKEQLL